MRARMEQISIATGEFACGASLSALGPVMLPNARLLNELNVPKGNPRMRTLIQCPDIVPCASASGLAGLVAPSEVIRAASFGRLSTLEGGPHRREMAMSIWRMLKAGMLGFMVKHAALERIDKLRGMPPTPVRVAEYVAKHATAGDPESVLRTIDRFAREIRWMMNVGPEKGPLITELADRLPANARVLEVGAYCGYSSIMLARALSASKPASPSIEISKTCVETARANVDVAGLGDRIAFLHGPSTEVLGTLEGRFDLVFLDHWKDLYKPDLQRMEKRGLVGPATNRRGRQRR